MRKYFILFILFSDLTVYAVDECSSKLSKEISLFSQICDKTKKQELQTLAEKNKDSVIQYLTEPSVKTCSSVTYKFPEINMKPKDSVYFHIPSEYRDRGVRFMILGHRQDPAKNKSQGEWDDKPGLSSVQIHSSDGWSYWNGQASGENGAKFAEVRSYPEIENLYDWDHYGYTNMQSGQTSTKDLLPDAMKVTSVGKDEVILSELTLKVKAPPETEKQEIIYSNGTEFTPQNPEQKYKLSGGQGYDGKFPGAKAIYGNNQIVIQLKAGMKITSIDIACGDSHPDGKKNKDGGIGTSGWAKLSVGIRRPDGKIQWLMNQENVPPEGVLMASPSSCDEVIEKGSELIIKSDSDTTYVMGTHIGYRK